MIHPIEIDTIDGIVQKKKYREWYVLNTPRRRFIKGSNRGDEKKYANGQVGWGKNTLKHG